jgi:hypothetical protein
MNTTETDSAQDYLRPDGFLLTPFHRKQSVYKNNPLFRSTLLIILAAFATVGFFAIQSYKITQIKNIAKEREFREKNESNKIQTQTLALKPTRTKFVELDSMRKQLRIPLAPVLDAIEKSIPDALTINRITTNCTPISTTDTQNRKMDVHIEVYFPPNSQQTDEFLGKWLLKLTNRLLSYGMTTTKIEWGNVRKFSASLEQEKQLKGKIGTIRELSFIVEITQEKS